MGVQLTYGTAGATGGGFSRWPVLLQPTFVESWHEPRWSYQQRSPKTLKDRNGWHSLWSFGMRVGCADAGGDGAAPLSNGMMDADPFEPFSCDSPGSHSMNFLRGTCKDSVGTPVANAIVHGFVSSTDAFLGQVQGNTDGTYSLGVEASKSTACYMVAYKAGSPDIAGSTVNTLLPTNVDGT